MYIVKKENGIITTVTDENEIQEFVGIKKETHLCGEVCQGLGSKRCPKIFDEVKANISEYNFIDSGYQLYNDEGNLEKFIVSGCKCFAPIVRKENKVLRKSLMDNVKMLYFDTETVKEADEKLESLIERGMVLKRSKRK